MVMERGFAGILASSFWCAGVADVRVRLVCGCGLCASVDGLRV